MEVFSSFVIPLVDRAYFVYILNGSSISIMMKTTSINNFVDIRKKLP